MLDDFASVVDDRRNDEAFRPRLAQHTPATPTEDAGSAPCRNMHFCLPLRESPQWVRLFNGGGAEGETDAPLATDACQNTPPGHEQHHHPERQSLLPRRIIQGPRVLSN